MTPARDTDALPGSRKGKPVGVLTFEWEDHAYGDLINRFFGHYLMYLKLEVVP